MLSVILLWLAFAAPALATWHHLGSVTSVEASGDQVLIRCGEASVMVTAFRPGVARIRLAPDGVFDREFSWAVEDLLPRGQVVGVAEDDQIIRFQIEPAAGDLEASRLRFEIQKKPCRIKVYDGNLRLLVADDADRGMSWRKRKPVNDVDPGQEVHVWQEFHDGRRIYGLGEKSGTLNKAGHAYHMWNTDAYAYQSSTDPLYKSFPMFLRAQNGSYHGIFLDNAWRTSFDFGQSERDIMSFGAEGGELDYYVIAGPAPKTVIERYTEMTGRLSLPPKWAIGYHQCRFSYYPESRVREVAKNFRSKRIPCDVLYFDIDYMQGYRCFTWSEKDFPHPRKLNDDLQAMGFHTVVIMDPGIKNEPGYAVFDQGEKYDAWVKLPTGKAYVGRVWPGDTVWPDFTNAAVRHWWANMQAEFMVKSGVDGIWNDMNEPSDFNGRNKTVPLNLVHDNAGAPAPHLACHNIYGMQMARAAMEGVKIAYPDRRPFVMTRATFAGGQRYGAAWTGDNISSWEHLRLSLTMVMNLGVSGMPYVGPDIGGFVGGATPQLYARWIQVGAFFPYARTHTGKFSRPQEPWSFGKRTEDIARKALELRYSLLPYTYTLFEESSRTGMPIVRPLWLEGVNAGDWDQRSMFMFGSQLLVMPVLYPDSPDRAIDPPDGVWFDWHSNRVLAGGQTMWQPLSKWEHMPMFARAGAIIPRQSPVQNTMESPDEPLIIDVWPFGESSGELYEDDGQSYDYRTGAYRRTRFSATRVQLSGREDGYTFTMHEATGDYQVGKRLPLVRLRGIFDPLADAPKVFRGPGKEPMATKVVQRADLAHSPGQYFQDIARGIVYVRLKADHGQQQQIELATRRPATEKPLVFNFDDEESGAAGTRDIVKSSYEDGVGTFRVASPWNVRLMPGRVRFDAGSLPLFRVRLSTESAKELAVYAASEQNPLAGREPIARISLKPDGRMHEFQTELSVDAPEAWQGTIYDLCFQFREGVRKDEIIHVDSIGFYPAK